MQIKQFDPPLEYQDKLEGLNYEVLNLLVSSIKSSISVFFFPNSI